MQYRPPLGPVQYAPDRQEHSPSNVGAMSDEAFPISPTAPPMYAVHERLLAETDPSLQINVSP